MRILWPCIGTLILAVAAPVLAAPPIFVAEDGIVAFEIESHPPVSGWEKQTKHSGYTGDGYYLSTGGGQLNWRILIIEAGEYELHLRNRHEHPDHTLENDCFTKMDNGPSWKTFSSKGGQWTWHTRHEPSHGKFRDPTYHLSAGIHVFQITGRSAGFMIDRIHFSKVGTDKKKATDHTIRPTVGYPLPPQLDKITSVTDAWRSGRLGQAWTLAEREKTGNNADQAAQALAALKAFAEERLDLCKQIKADDPIAAVLLLESTAKPFSGCPQGSQMSTLLRQWKTDPKYRKISAAHQIFDQMNLAHAQIKGKGTIKDSKFAMQNQQALGMIHSGYRRIKARYADTPVYDKARQMVVELGFSE